MNSPDCVLALDQGTTGTTAMLIEASGAPIRAVNREIRQFYSRPGWVEHDPIELFQSCLAAAREAMDAAGVSPRSVAALGITNQRETAVVWERASGAPVANAVVWQCRRTAEICDSLKARGLESAVRRKTGLPIDAYFTGPKIRWLLDNIPDGQRRAERGELACGTVDSWLIWNFTDKRAHATDTTNASRTMLFDIERLDWDDELLGALDIPRAILPEVRSSSEVFGYAAGEPFAGARIPISGVAGDQHASLFGHARFARGEAKNTYGTGCFALTNTGGERVESKSGLLSTVAWTVGGETRYALEGSVFSAGAAVQWLRDGLGIIESAAETAALAASVSDNGGAYLVPAFSGLGAPHWDMRARGAIVGLTRGTTRAHLARAALESIAYQTRDVLDAMAQDAGTRPPSLRADGGAASNDWLMQFQADATNIPIERSAVRETTALGAGFLAGLGAGFWRDQSELAATWRADAVFEPRMSEDERESLYAGWLRAVGRVLG